MLNKPSFFIVGAPKCGTTAMCDYLNQHPDIFIPSLKEPNFFGSDLTGARPIKNLYEYSKLFEEARGRKSGEGSTWYLFSLLAANEIHHFNPEAKIIIMLRNPVELLHSLHNQMVYDGRNEDIEDFAEALNAEKDRKNGKRIPEGCLRREALIYTEVVKFYSQLERYINVFGRERVRIILYEEFKSETLRIYKETLQFLAINEDFVPEFKVVNASKRVKNRTLQSMTRDISIIKPLARMLIPTSISDKIKNKIATYNTIYEKRTPIDPLVKKQLHQIFNPEMEKVQNLIHKDLSKWIV